MAVVNAQLVKELREMTGSGMMDCKNALVAVDGDIDKAILWLRENGLAKAAKKADRVAAEGIALAKQNKDGAVIIEVNSETDFVSKNEKFVNLINSFADAILKAKPKNNEEALNVKLTNNETIEQACLSATATIGEKISFRRFASECSCSNSKVVVYNHSNGRISTLLKFQGGISKEDAYNVAMHVAAMNPKYINISDIPENFKNEEMHILREQSKEELASKNEAIREKILNGKLSKRLAEVTLSEQEYVLNDKMKVGAFVKSCGATIEAMHRFEVGEGIEKEVVDFAKEVADQLNK